MRTSRIHSRSVPAVYASLLFLLFFLPTVSIAQSWQRIGSDLNDVQWIQGGTVVAVGSYGTIMRSEDGGKGWKYQTSGISEHLNAVHFFSAAEGIVVGDNGKALLTDDGGERWNVLPLPVEESITDVGFTEDNSVGLAVTFKGTFLTTFDRGVSWSVADSTGENLSTLVVVDDSTAVAAGSRGLIVRTTDWGHSWETVYRGDTTLTFVDLDYRDGLCLAVGANPIYLGGTVLLRTTDKGASWSRVGTEALDFLAHSVHIGDADHILVVGQRPATSDVYRERSAYTTDGGTTWTESQLNEVQGYLDVKRIAFSSGEVGEGVAVGTHGGIYRTSDGGESWEVISYARLYEPINQVGFYSYLNGAYFFDADTGIVYGSDGWGAGYALRTTDGGTTWKSIYTNAAINGVYFFNDNTGIGVPGNTVTINTDQKIFGIDNYGEDWSLRERVFDGEYRYYFSSGIVGVDETTLAFTGDSTIFESTDRGESWVKVVSLSGLVDIRDLQYIGKYGWVCGTYVDRLTGPGTRVSKGGVFRTSVADRSTWELVYVDSGADYTIRPYALWFLDEQKGFMGNLAGTLYRTTDAGDTWDSVAQFDNGIGDIRFFSDSIGFATGSRAMIMKTTDGGDTWEQETPWPEIQEDSQKAFVSITLLPDERTVLLVGSGLIARKEYPDKLTSVEEEVSDDGRGGDLQSGTLRFSILPNPLVGKDQFVVRIEGLVPDDRSSTFQLYNSSGKLVRSEVVRVQGSGERADLTVKSVGLPSGSYYVRFVRGGHVYSVGSVMIGE